MESGIYEIRNTVNGQRYIGQSSDIEKRWKQHLYRLNNKTSTNKKLQNAWDKYGRYAFSFSVIGECLPYKAALNFFENVALTSCKPEYNVCVIAGTVLGVKRTPEQRAAKSKLMMGIKYPPRAKEVCEKIAERMKGNKYGVGSKSMLGKKHSLEAKAKMSAFQKGRKHGPMAEKTKLKLYLSNIGNKYALGHRHSAESKEKMGCQRRGKKFGPPSDAQRMKQSIALKGKPWSEKRRAAYEMKVA